MTRFRHDPSQSARGFVDNASALPTTPPAPQHHEKRTFDALPKADIFTRHGQASIGRRPAVLRIVPYYAAALALLYV